MQERVEKLSNVCYSFRLTISTKKTEVLHQAAPGKPYLEPDIKVNGERLKAVDKFTYLGRPISKSVKIDDEVLCRLAKASSTF